MKKTTLYIALHVNCCSLPTALALCSVLYCTHCVLHTCAQGINMNLNITFLSVIHFSAQIDVGLGDLLGGDRHQFSL